jgi:hypothetical protein
MTISRCLAALPLVLLGWLATLALVMRLGGEAPAALVLFPPAGMVAALPDGVAVVGSGPVSLTLRGEADLVVRLYALGAPLVLPAGLAGCADQPLVW